MANVSMTELREGHPTTALGRDDLIEVVQAGESKGATVGETRRTDINEQTGTTYVLALTDAGKAVEMNNSAANTLTIPDAASVAFDVGESILLRQMGVGQTTIVAASGVTILNPHATLKIRVRYGAVSLHKRAENTWCIEGNLAES